MILLIVTAILLVWTIGSFAYFIQDGGILEDTWWRWAIYLPLLVISFVFGWTRWLFSKPREPVVVGGEIEPVKGGYMAQVRVHGEKNQYYVIDIMSQSEISVRVRK